MSSKIVRAGLLMYRYGKEGLEVLLINEKGEETWSIPNGKINEAESSFTAAQREFIQGTGIEPEGEEFIALDCVECEDGKIKAWAFEEDNGVSDLPLRHILKTESPLRLRRKHKLLMEKGAWFCTKEAIKKVFPSEVELIKELLEILSDRNQAKYV